MTNPDRSIPPRTFPIGELHLPEGKIMNLTNGARLRVADGGDHDVCQLILTFRGGTQECTPREAIRLCADTLFEGTTSTSGAQIAETMDFNGCVYNAASSQHFTSVTFAAPNSHIRAALPTLQDVLLYPDFPDSALDLYKQRAIQRLQQNRRRVAYTADRMLAVMLAGAGNPAAAEDDAGSISSVSRDTLSRIHRDVFSGGGCEAVLCGRIDDGVLDAIISVLNLLPASAPTPLRIYPYTPEPPQIRIEDLPGAQQSAISIGIPTIMRDHPDYVPLRAAVIALGGYFGSRLMSNIREDKGLTYGISAALCGSQDGAYINIQAQTDARYIDQVITEVRHEMSALASDPPAGDELRRLQLRLQANLLSILDSPFAIGDFYHSAIITGIPSDYFARQAEISRNVSPGLISEMASKYIRPEECRISVVRNTVAQ